MRIDLLAVVAAMATVLSAFAAESTAMRLYCSPSCNMTWQTITAPTVSLRLNWPNGATGAELKIVNAMGQTILSKHVVAGTVSQDWTVFSGEVPAADDCFSVTVEYSTGDIDTAVLALETGTFAPITVHVADSNRSFACTPVGRAVAYDTAWLGVGMEEMVDLTSVFRATGTETVQSAGISKNGYFRWAPVDNAGKQGRYDLTLSCGDHFTTGYAYYGNVGLSIVIR